MIGQLFDFQPVRARIKFCLYLSAGRTSCSLLVSFNVLQLKMAMKIVNWTDKCIVQKINQSCSSDLWWWWDEAVADKAGGSSPLALVRLGDLFGKGNAADICHKHGDTISYSHHGFRLPPKPTRVHFHFCTPHVPVLMLQWTHWHVLLLLQFLPGTAYGFGRNVSI